MPEGVGYGPQNTASIGKNLIVIGEHAYGYSGIITAGGSDTTMLKFTSGNYIFVGTVQFFYATSGASDVQYSVFFNGEGVLEYTTDSAAAGVNASEPDNMIPIIIPPYTEVETTCKGANNHYSILTGKIFGKLD